MQIQRTLAAAIVGGSLALGAAQASAEIQKYNFEVVGTWGFLENWKEFEKKFWTEMLPKASGGKLTANAKPYTELGIKGYEVMSGLKKGAYDAVHALTSYSAKASPALEGIDLAGVIQDFGTYRKAVNAYRSILEREVAEKYNEAMKDGNLSAKEKQEIAKDDEIIKVLKKMRKQRLDSAELYKKGERQELLKAEEEEIKIIDSFLPKQLSDEETTKICKEIIKSLGASNIKDMGKIMGALKSKHADTLDFTKVSIILKGLLN